VPVSTGQEVDQSERRLGAKRYSVEDQ